jgi:hypothetical protein
MNEWWGQVGTEGGVDVVMRGKKCASGGNRVRIPLSFMLQSDYCSDWAKLTLNAKSLKVKEQILLQTKQFWKGDRLYGSISHSFHVASTNVRPPLWYSGQSSWLQIRRPGFDSRHYQIFWRKKTVVGLERGPLSIVSTTEQLLDRKVAAPV